MSGGEVIVARLGADIDLVVELAGGCDGAYIADWTQKLGLGSLWQEVQT